MKENELHFYTNTKTYLFHSIYLFLILFSFHMSALKLDGFLKYLSIFFEAILILTLISYIIQTIKSFLDKPVITLTENAFVEHKIGYTIKWDDILKINKYGDNNRAIEIILKWNYTNYDTIKNPLNKLHIKLKNGFSSKRKYIYLNYMGGDVEEIVDVMNEYKENLNS